MTTQITTAAGTFELFEMPAFAVFATRKAAETNAARAPRWLPDAADSAHVFERGEGKFLVAVCNTDDGIAYFSGIFPLTDYDLLKAEGHSPAKAAEIVLDASRGDKWAIDWIAAARGKVAA